MSHELRTPLNAVSVFRSARRRILRPVNDRQRRYVEHIHTGGKHLLSLHRDILDFVQGSSRPHGIEQRKPARWNPFLAEVLSVMPLGGQEIAVPYRKTQPA